MSTSEDEPIAEFPRLRAVQGGKTYEPPDPDWLSPMVVRQCFLAKKKGEKARLHLFKVVAKEGKEILGFCLQGEDNAFVWVDPKAYCAQFSLYLDFGVDQSYVAVEGVKGDGDNRTV